MYEFYTHFVDRASQEISRIDDCTLSNENRWFQIDPEIFNTFFNNTLTQSEAKLKFKELITKNEMLDRRFSIEGWTATFKNPIHKPAFTRWFCDATKFLIHDKGYLSTCMLSFYGAIVVSIVLILIYIKPRKC